MYRMDHGRALVLFSGGQDSSIVLARTLARFDYVETVCFDYGQRHDVELGARIEVRDAMFRICPQWADRYGGDTTLDAKGLRDTGRTAMTARTRIETGEKGLPTTFVPGRNLLFLTLAGALAYRRNTGVLVAGMCETDFSGYPDCRQEALDFQIRALRAGMDADIAFEAPLMHLSKAESWRLAERLGGTELVAAINEFSHTCYRGERGYRHSWGYGCGTCPACVLRARGWEQYCG